MGKGTITLSMLILVCGFAMMSMGQYGGCACVNPLDSSSGPTPTCTPDHGPVIADFENGVVGINNFGGEIVAEGGFSASGFNPPHVPACTNFVQPFGSSYELGGNPSGTSAHCIRYRGVIASNIDPYPYAQLKFLDLKGWQTYAVNHRISFWAKNLIVGVSPQFRVEAMCSFICNADQYGYTFSVPGDGAWHQQTVYFPGYGVPTMTRQCWPGSCAGGPMYCIDWDATHLDSCGCGGATGRPHGSVPYASQNISGIQFKTMAATCSNNTFDLLLDDIRFE